MLKSDANKNHETFKARNIRTCNCSSSRTKAHESWKRTALSGTTSSAPSDENWPSPWSPRTHATSPKRMYKNLGSTKQTPLPGTGFLTQNLSKCGLNGSLLKTESVVLPKLAPSHEAPNLINNHLITSMPSFADHETTGCIITHHDSRPIPPPWVCRHSSQLMSAQLPTSPAVWTCIPDVHQMDACTAALALITKLPPIFDQNLSKCGPNGSLLTTESVALSKLAPTHEAPNLIKNQLIASYFNAFLCRSQNHHQLGCIITHHGSVVTRCSSRPPNSPHHTRHFRHL